MPSLLRKLRPSRAKTYRGIHAWIYERWGKPLECEHCGTTTRKLDWSNKDHKYRLERRFWQTLCKSCHRKYDFGRFGTGKLGRAPHPRKLSLDDAQKIRKLYLKGDISQRSLGKVFHVSETTISYIINNKTYLALAARDRVKKAMRNE